MLHDDCKQMSLSFKWCHSFLIFHEDMLCKMETGENFLQERHQAIKNLLQGIPSDLLSKHGKTNIKNNNDNDI